MPYLIPVAHAYNFINVDAGFATGTMTYASGLFQDFQTPIYLLLGVVIFGALVAFIVGVFTHHK